MLMGHLPTEMNSKALALYASEKCLSAQIRTSAVVAELRMASSWLSGSIVWERSTASVCTGSS